MLNNAVNDGTLVQSVVFKCDALMNTSFSLLKKSKVSLSADY